MEGMVTPDDVPPASAQFYEGKPVPHYGSKPVSGSKRPFADKARICAPMGAPQSPTSLITRYVSLNRMIPCARRCAHWTWASQPGKTRSTDPICGPHLMASYLNRAFTWWNGQTLGTQLFTWRKGEKVGEDAQGNIHKFFV